MSSASVSPKNMTKLQPSLLDTNFHPDTINALVAMTTACKAMEKQSDITLIAAMAANVPSVLWLYLTTPVDYAEATSDNDTITILYDWSAAVSGCLLALAQLFCSLRVDSSRDSASTRGSKSIYNRTSNSTIRHKLADAVLEPLVRDAPVLLNNASIPFVIECCVALFDAYISQQSPATFMTYAMAMDHMFSLEHNRRGVNDIPSRLMEALPGSLSAYYIHVKHMLEQLLSDLSDDHVAPNVLQPQLSHRISISSMGSNRPYVVQSPKVSSFNNRRNISTPTTRHLKWKLVYFTLTRETIRMSLRTLFYIMNASLKMESTSESLQSERSSPGLDWSKLGISKHVDTFAQKLEKTLNRTAQVTSPHAIGVQVNGDLKVAVTQLTLGLEHPGAVDDTVACKWLARHAMSTLEKRCNYEDNMDLGMAAKSALALHTRNLAATTKSRTRVGSVSSDAPPTESDMDYV